MSRPDPLVRLNLGDIDDFVKDQKQHYIYGMKRL